MDEKIKKHVGEYRKRRGEDDSEDSIIGLIRYSEEIHSKVVDTRRWWWNDVFKVVEIDGMLIGFDDAETTGDRSPSDVGFEFDPESIVEVEKIVEIKEVASYKKK
jgi:hypothetical protein